MPNRNGEESANEMNDSQFSRQVAGVRVAGNRAGVSYRAWYFPSPRPRILAQLPGEIGRGDIHAHKTGRRHAAKEQSVKPPVEAPEIQRQLALDAEFKMRQRMLEFQPPRLDYFSGSARREFVGGLYGITGFAAGWWFIGHMAA